MISWTQGVTFRVLGIGFLALLMLIPLVQVQGLITERRDLEHEARLKIAERMVADYAELFTRVAAGAAASTGPSASSRSSSAGTSTNANRTESSLAP